MVFLFATFRADTASEDVICLSLVLEFSFKHLTKYYGALLVVEIVRNRMEFAQARWTDSPIHQHHPYSARLIYALANRARTTALIPLFTMGAIYTAKGITSA